MQAGVHASWQSMTRSGYSPGRFGCDHLVGRDRRPVIFTCIPGYLGNRGWKPTLSDANRTYPTGW
jgi:hypothetical protein